MKAQYVKVFKNHAKLKEEFRKFADTIEKIKNLQNFEKDYYTISYAQNKVETPEYVTYFVVEDREFFMGRTLDWVSFDDSETFNGKVVNEVIERILRTKTRRLLDENHNR